MGFVLALAMGIMAWVPAEAISLGVGIGFGHGVGIFGEVGGSVPVSEREEATPEINLTKEEITVLKEAKADTRRVAYGVYKTTIDGDFPSVTEALLQALEGEEWRPLSEKRGEDGQGLYITAWPVDRLSIHMMEKHPMWALYWQTSLVVKPDGKKTVIWWMSPLRCVREKDMDGARGRLLEERLVSALSHVGRTVQEKGEKQK